MKTLFAMLACLALAACSTLTTTDPATGKTTTSIQPVDFTQTAIAKLTSADLDAAAARATANGFPARAQMWQAIKAIKVANETQATACAKAITAALPSGGASPQFAGAADALEAAAEAVASFQVSPAIKGNCEPIPIPALLPLPAIPK